MRRRLQETKMRHFALTTMALAICALGLSALPASAAAIVYTFNQDACSSPGCGLSSYGTVTVTDLFNSGNPAGVNVNVSLLGGSGLIHSGALDNHTLIFSLAGTPSITITGLPSQWTYTHAVPDYTAKGNMFGDFDYLIDCNDACGPNNPYTSALDFNITTPSITTASFIDGGTATETYFVADISNPNLTGPMALTGRIGASYTGVPTTQTPEPFTMSLFGMGLAGMAALRRRKSTSGAAVA